MCGGGGFTPPAETEAQKAEREARSQQLESQKMEAQEQRSKDKSMRLQESVARTGGMYGFRSLISGRRGGSGFGREMLG